MHHTQFLVRTEKKKVENKRQISAACLFFARFLVNLSSNDLHESCAVAGSFSSFSFSFASRQIALFRLKCMYIFFYSMCIVNHCMHSTFFLSLSTSIDFDSWIFLRLNCVWAAKVMEKKSERQQPQHKSIIIIIIVCISTRVWNST